MKSEKQLKEKSTRIRRNRVATAGPLFIDEKYNRPGFVRRIVNDTPGKLDRAKRLGYTVVQDTELQIGDSPANTSGTAVTVQVGRSKPMTGVLMEIPVDMWEENQAEKEEINKENEAELDQLGIETQHGAITRE